MMNVIDAYTLKHPHPYIVRDSKGETPREITEVRFRAAVGRDLLAMDKAEGENGKLFAFISHVSDLALAHLKKLELADTRALMRIGNRMLAGKLLPEEQKALIEDANFRKPVGGDLLAMDEAEGDYGKLFAFIEHISDVKMAQLQEWDIAKVRVLVREADRFFGNGQETGGTSSAD